jgi:carboxylesterase
LYQQNTNNSTADLSKPIILAIHGYSATTFEWDEFRDYSVNANYRISQVLLGGHGRDYQTFKASNWQGWRSSITEE